MPIWFNCRSYVFDRSVYPDASPEEKEEQKCNCGPARVDLEKVSAYSQITKFPHHNDFGDVGGTELIVDGKYMYIETRYKDFCSVMERYSGKPHSLD